MPDLLEEAKRLSITEAQYAEAHSQGFSDGVAYAELKADQEKAELVERLEQAKKKNELLSSAYAHLKNGQKAKAERLALAARQQEATR